MKKLFLILAGLLLTVNCSAQEAATDGVFVLDDFSGGINSQLSPFNLPNNQATICENARLNDEFKSLVKRKQVLSSGTADTTEAITGGHRLYLKDGTKVTVITHGDEIEKGDDSAGTFSKILDLTTGDYRWQWTTWNNVAIGTDGYNQPVKYNNASSTVTAFDSYIKYLLHGDGVDGSTTFTDELNKTWTASGNAQIDTAQKKFDTASVQFDGTGDYIYTADNNDVYFGSGDFTIDFWARWNALPAGGAAQTLFSQWTSNNNNLTFDVTESSGNYNMGFTVTSGGAGIIAVSKLNQALSTATWYHFELSRSGNYFQIFLDGTSLVTEYNFIPIPDFSANFNIGTYDGSSQFFNGWIDEFRISKGIARHTANFTPETGAYAGTTTTTYYATYLGSCLAIPTTSGAGPNGTYHYKVTFYTASYEVAFNVVSNSVVVSNKDISLSMIPIAPDTYAGETVTGRKIYRHANGGTTYYLLSNGTIANNTATTLTDSDADGDLTVTTYPTTYTCTPPKGRLCLIHYNRLFLANDPNAPSRLYYSDDGNVDYFLPTDYYRDIRPDDGDQITFIKTFLGLLTVGKENSIQKVYTDGASPAADWNTSDIFTNVGCKAMYSAQETPVGIIYLGSDGLYKFNGQSSALISNSIIPEVRDILESNRQNCWGAFYKNIYYLSYASKKTGTATNNRILLYNLINNSFSIDILNANCFISYNSGTDWDTLYYGSSTDGAVYSYTFQTYELQHNKHSDFTGNFINTRYIPTAVGGDVNDPIIEIARTATINGLIGTIDSLTGTIDRDSLTGSYTSPALNVGATKYDKLYWNEKFFASSDTMTVALRSATDDILIASASWSSEYTDSTGTDVSDLSASTWVQYRISMSTNTYDHSPQLYKANNYCVKLSYLKEATTTESTIPMEWKSGWLDFKPGYKKTLRKITVYHEGTAGTLNIKFTNFEGDSDTFAINLTDNPKFYEEYFTNGRFIGNLFQIDITNSDLNDLKINKIVVVFDVEPLY